MNFLSTAREYPTRRGRVKAMKRHPVAMMTHMQAGIMWKMGPLMLLRTTNHHRVERISS